MARTSSSAAATGAERSSPRNIRPKGPDKKRFDTIFSLGKRAKGHLARIIAYPGSGLIGIGVSRKIGSKPRRNRLKRQFRAAIASQTDPVDLRLDFVIVVNEEAANASFASIVSEVRALFSEITKRWAAELESS